jgi:hypothetical protein
MAFCCMLPRSKTAKNRIGATFCVDRPATASLDDGALNIFAPFFVMLTGCWLPDDRPAIIFLVKLGAAPQLRGALSV